MSTGSGDALMDIPQCYRLLELEEGASEEEIRRGYRDLVRVWHPDRFGADPVLRRRAEEKSKQLNVAYETLLRTRKHRGGGKEGGPPTGGRGPASQGATEALFEAGTRAVLTIWHSLSRALRSAVEETGTETGNRKTRRNGL